jgi:GTPase SAR1 family protein
MVNDSLFPPMDESDHGLIQPLQELVDLGILPDEHCLRVAEAVEKLSEETVYVAVLGDFKRGKSTLINALLGQSVLPVGVIPVTAVPTLCRWSDEERLLVRFDHEEDVHPLAELATFVTEVGNPENRRGIREVIVELDAPILRDGVVLVDTPGTGSVYAHNTAAARSFLPRVDVAIAVLTVDAPLSEGEGQLLRELSGEVARLLVCLNKADLLTAAELDQALAFVQEGVYKLLERDDVPIVPVAARAALEGAGDTGLDMVRAWLHEVVVAQRSSIARERALHVGRAAYDVAESIVRLERSALETPQEEIAQRRLDFDRALASLEDDAREAKLLLSDAGKRIAAANVMTMADELRRTLPAELLQTDDGASWQEVERGAAERWIATATRLITNELRPALERHARRIDELTRHFISTAGELFHVELPAAPMVNDALALPPVRITVPDEPGVLDMGIRGIRQIVPGTLGQRWRERARAARAAEAADRLAGRLRYAADQAIRQAIQTWSRQLDAQWQAIGQALQRAIARSEEALASGERAMAAEWQQITTLEQRLAAIAEKLKRQQPSLNR